MRYVFRKKLNYPYDNPLIQSEAKGTHAITPDLMGGPCDYRRAEGYPLLQIESEGYHRDSLIFFEIHNA